VPLLTVLRREDERADERRIQRDRALQPEERRRIEGLVPGGVVVRVPGDPDAEQREQDDDRRGPTDRCRERLDVALCRRPLALGAGANRGDRLGVLLDLRKLRSVAEITMLGVPAHAATVLPPRGGGQEARRHFCDATAGRGERCGIVLEEAANENHAP
jgi:hypothetical protein